MAKIAAVAPFSGGAFAIGATPGGQGKINACYVKNGKRKGQVRLLVPGSKCRKGEGKIAWNQTGS